MPLMGVVPLKKVTLPPGARPRLVVFTTAVKVTEVPALILEGVAVTLVAVVAGVMVIPTAVEVLVL